MWHPNSPDLNPLQRVGNTTEGVQKHKLKERVRTEWGKLDHVVIAAAVRQWRRRLSACVKVGAGHFEQRP